MIYDALQLLKERRSVKKYKDDQISEEQLDKILEAGLYAASGKNGQKTIMLAVTKKEDVKMLSNLNAKILGVDIDPFYNAPAVIVVFADKNHSTYLEDGSLVLGNLMVEAFSIGVDSCWIHRAKQMFETEKGRVYAREHGIPDDYVGIGNCVLGFKEGNLPECKPRREGRIIKVK